MNGKNVNFGDKKVKKVTFTKTKRRTIRYKNLFKCFIGYNDNDVIRPLRMKLPQMIGYVRKFEGNTNMSFKINDSKLLKKYNQM